VVGTVLDTFVENIAVVALLVSAGLLILLGSNIAFEVDTRLKTIVDPLGPVRTTWEWRYMSDFAQNARLEALNLANLLRIAITTMLLLALTFFAIAVVVGLAEGWSRTLADADTCSSNVYYSFACRHFGSVAVDIVNWWKTAPSIQDWLKSMFALLILSFGPIMTYRLARFVFNLVKAREHHIVNKDPWWT